MNIKINGEDRTIEDAANISQILRHLDLQTEHGVAVALNHTLVPRSRFEETCLEEGDSLEIVHATAGG